MEKKYFHSDEEWLQTDWFGLSRKMMVGGGWSRQTFEYFRNQYLQEERYYHNFAHIGNMMKTAVNLSLEDPVAVKLSIWFHDVIYRPVLGSSEKASAKKALKMLSDTSLTEEQAHKIEHYILATKAHIPLTEDKDERLFLDLDLMILGTPQDIYDAYSEKIRMEYGRIPTFLYNKGRRKALEAFLERDSIFFSDSFRRKYEETARENIQRELVTLR